MKKVCRIIPLIIVFLMVVGCADKRNEEESYIANHPSVDNVDVQETTDYNSSIESISAVDEGNESYTEQISEGEVTFTTSKNDSTKPISTKPTAGRTTTRPITTSHKHTVVTDKAVSATCTRTGKTQGSHCSTCGAIIVKQNILPKKSHSTVEDKAIAATCTSAGKTQGSHCSVCGYVIKKQENIPAKGHTPVVDKGISATCEKDGLTSGKHCSVCGFVIEKQNVIDKLGHSYSDWKIEKPSSCTEDGIKISLCERCGDRRQETIASEGHSYGEWQIEKDATCTKDGIKASVCNKCGDKKTENIAALGHSYGEWKTEKQATCTEKGKEVQICERCKDKNTRQTEATGHSYTDQLVPASGGKDAYVKSTCSKCKHTVNKPIPPISVSVRYSTKAEVSLPGYHAVSVGYKIYATGGYGAYEYKEELYSASGILLQTMDYNSTDGFEVTNPIEGSYVIVTVRDEAGTTGSVKYYLEY